MIARINKAGFSREKKRLDKLLSAIAQQGYRAAHESGDKYVRLVKSGIGVTSAPPFAPHWPPLSEFWKAIKKDNKDKFWAETYGIYRAIGVKTLKKSNREILIFAGILKETDPDAFERAQKNEYGLGLGPERPLFEPAKDVISTMTPSGRKLKDKNRFKNVVAIAARKVK